MNYKLICFLQCVVLSSSKIELKLPQVYEDVDEAPSNVNRRVWSQPQMDLMRWRYTQQQNADMLNLINFGKKKREIHNLFSSPPLYLIQQVPVDFYQQPNYQIEMLSGLIGKNPQIQLQGLQQLLEMDKPITENVPDVTNPQKQPNIQVNEYQQPQDYFVQVQENQLQVEPKSEAVYQPATEASVTKKDGNSVSIKNSSKSRKKRGADDYYYYEYEMVDDDKNNNNNSEVIYEYVYEDDSGDKTNISEQQTSMKEENPSGGVVMQPHQVSFLPMLEQHKIPPSSGNMMNLKEDIDDYDSINKQLHSLLEKRKRLQELKNLTKQNMHLEQQNNQKDSMTRFSPMVFQNYQMESPAHPQGSSVGNNYLPMLKKHLNFQNIKPKREAEKLPIPDESIVEETDIYSTIQKEYLPGVEDKRPVNLIVINNSNDNHRSKETKSQDHSKTEIIKKIPIEYHPPAINLLPAPKVQVPHQHHKHNHNHHHKHQHKHHHKRPPKRPPYRRVPSKKSSQKRILSKIHNAFSKFGI